MSTNPNPLPIAGVALGPGAATLGPRQRWWHVLNRRRSSRRRNPSDLESQTSTQDNSLTIPTSASTAPTPSTAATSNTGTAPIPHSASPGTSCIQGVHFFPEAPRDPSICQHWKDNIKPRFLIELRNRYSTADWQLEFMVAGPRPECASLSIILWWGEPGSRSRVSRYCNDLFYLREFIEQHNVNYYVMNGIPVQQAATMAGWASESFLSVEGSNLLVSSGSASCAFILEFGSFGSVPAKRCTLGGFVTIDSKTYGITTRHSIEAHTKRLMDNQNLPDTTFSRAATQRSSTFGTNDSPRVSIYNGSLESDNASSSSATTAGTSATLPDTYSDGPVRSQPLSGGTRCVQVDLLCPKPLGEDGPLQHLQATDYDWALVSLSTTIRLPVQASTVPNAPSERPIRGAYSGVDEPEGAVSIMIAGGESVPGMLSSSPATYKIGKSLQNVRLITLYQKLPLGSSGAWVMMDDLVCGVIVTARSDVPWAYMIPIREILEDIKRTVCANDVHIATLDEITAWRDSPNRPQSSHVTTNSEKGSSGTSQDTSESTRDYGKHASALPQSALLERSIAVPVNKDKSDAKRKRPPSFLTKFFQNLRTARSPSTSEVMHRTSIADHSKSQPILQNELCTTLTILHDGKRLGRRENVCFEWLRSTAFDYIRGLAMEILHQHGLDTTEQSCRFTVTCHLARFYLGKTLEFKSWENQTQWSEDLKQEIMAFLMQNPHAEFHLEMVLEYATLIIPKSKGEPYSQAVQDAIHRKMRYNWQKRRFIPRGDLDAIFTRSTVATLVDEDVTLHFPGPVSLNSVRPLERDRFVDDVTTSACRLLAICVYVDLPLLCLQKLIMNDIKDVHLPLDDSHCPDERYRVRWHWWTLVQGGFIAHTFHKDTQGPLYQEVHPQIVVPIMFDEKEDLIGEGGFGQVFRVGIDPDHHAFSDDKARTFALKIFFEHGTRTYEDFKHESRMLKAMSALPHHHITTHLAAWTQNDRFYMLFPQAEMNLGNFLRATPRPELSKDNVVWLLSQLKGIAEGVRHIHLLAMEPSPLDNGLGTLPRQGRTCFHHDLKPANILVFRHSDHSEDLPITSSVFKISDFGCSRVGLMLSGSGLRPESFFTNHRSQGDAAYAAPDWLLEGKTSRPYDIWSLGCIFLEVMVWAFGLSNAGPEDFAVKRITSRDSKSQQSLAFWYQDSAGIVKLKPTVIDQLKHLRSFSEGKSAFVHLIDTTAKLLAIRTKDRLDAPTLCNELDIVMLQAQWDLNDDECSYLRDVWSMQAVAAPATTSTLVDSKRPSIDERSIGALHPDDHNQEHIPGTADEVNIQVGLSPLSTKNLSQPWARSRSPSISIPLHDEILPGGEWAGGPTSREQTAAEADLDWMTVDPTAIPNLDELRISWYSQPSCLTGRSSCSHETQDKIARALKGRN